MINDHLFRHSVFLVVVFSPCPLLQDKQGGTGRVFQLGYVVVGLPTEQQYILVCISTCVILLLARVPNDFGTENQINLEDKGLGT